MISVVVSCYNEESYIEEALESVVNQTGWEYIDEVIVVDDGSEDNSGSLIKNFADKYQKIHYIFQSNQGVSVAKNRGIKASDSDWIAFLDGDDQWEPGKIEKQVDFVLEHPEVGLVYTDYFIKEKSDQEVPRVASHYTYDQNREKVLEGLFITGGPVFPSTVLVRRACLDDVGLFDPEFSRSQDFDLALRVAAQYPIHHIPEQLIVKNEGSGNLSSDYEKAAKDLRKIVKKIVKNYPQLESLKREKLARIDLGQGYYYLKDSRRQKGRAYLSKALSKYKWMPKAYLYTAISLIPLFNPADILSLVKTPWFLAKNVHRRYLKGKQNLTEILKAFRKVNSRKS